MLTKKHGPVKFGIAVLLTLATRTLADTPDHKLSLDYTNMSLEELMNVPVTTITLTQTDRYMAPAAVTHIDRSMIDQANSRSLNDLLGVYVPDMEFADHTFEARHLGMRGIIGDRDDKYLMLVNGRDMNERTHYGALTERDMILMGDINQIDVVRGPGSATYGPGAVMGVLSLTTFNGLSFQGSQITVHQGFMDQYSSIEYKFGKKFNDDTGLFLYGGIADMEGAAAGNAPIIQGWNWNSPRSGPVRAGEPVSLPFDKEDQEFNHSPHKKFHIQFDTGGLTTWVRYSEGGMMLNQTDKVYAPGTWGNADGFPLFEAGVGYQQLTAFVGYKAALSEHLTLDLSTSWDATDYRRFFLFGPANSHQEQKSISDAKLTWTGLPSHQMAAGVEYGFYWLGLNSWMAPSLTLADNEHPWQTAMGSLFYEDQWSINKQLTLFTSARLDKHSYTDVMFSPRLALIWTPTDKDALKLIGAQSLRTNTEEGMRADWLNNKRSDPEKMRSYEVRYERRQTQDLMFASSIFYDKLDVLAWNDTAQQEIPSGMYKTAGLELEGQYHTGNDTFTLSHAFTKLVGENIHSNNFITSTGFGYGYDLNAWSNNVTKLTAHHQVDQHLSLDGNIQVMWGYPGGKDFMLWHNQQALTGLGLGDASNPASWNKPYGISATLNLGAQYKFDQHSTLRVDAYNVLGWVDKTLNKDMVLGSLWEGAFREQSPAFSISFDYKF